MAFARSASPAPTHCPICPETKVDGQSKDDEGTDDGQHGGRDSADAVMVVARLMIKDEPVSSFCGFVVPFSLKLSAADDVVVQVQRSESYASSEFGETIYLEQKKVIAIPPLWNTQNAASQSEFSFQDMCEAISVPTLISNYVAVNFYRVLAHHAADLDHTEKGFPIICAPETAFAVVRNGLDVFHEAIYFGYEEQQKQLFAWIALYSALGLSLNNFMILSGPTGVGKSACISKTISEFHGINSATLQISEVIMFTTVLDNSDEVINEENSPSRTVCEVALSSAPCVLVIEGLDLICEGSPLSAASSAVKRLVEDLSSLKTLSARNAAGLSARDIRLLVSYTLQNAILRHESPPTSLTPPVIADIPTSDIDDLIAQLSDMSLVQRAATMEFDRRIVAGKVEVVEEPEGKAFEVSWNPDGVLALRKMQRLQLNEEGFEMRKPEMDARKVAGYEQIRKRFHNLISFPIDHKDTYTRLGVTPPSGILLYGPSGCGKTFLVHAITSTLPVNFISVKGNKLYSKYFGETEERLRKVFDLAQRMAPCILFFDDVDTIGTRREWDEDGVSGLHERILSTLLNEMDGVSSREGVMVVGTTSKPEKLDDALLRPGRLDQHIYIPLPTLHDRLSILTSLHPSTPDLNDPFSPFSDTEPPWDPLRLAHLTRTFTCSDLVVLIREASLLSLREHGIKLEQYLRGGEDSSSDEEGIMRKVLERRGDVGRMKGWWRPGRVTEAEVKAFEVFRDGRKK
ncbi:P-loop containing nucleoside triphosphate hydrolase protein [Chytridium lagenaria]|nr:P-loop containing nucleoside triphosphate hydrolase protein [Chytridium lagenaria]